MLGAIGALVLSLYVVATALAGTRQLWHDELYTYYIAKAPSMGALFREVKLDLNPPLEYLLVRASLHTFGDSAYAARLPSMAGFLLGSWCLARFVAKRAGFFYGLLSLLTIWATPFFAYATEARPYGLVFGWLGLAMLAWEASVREERQRWAVPALAGCVTGLMLSHLFAVFFLTPFGLAEAWRTYRRRKIDGPIWAALLLPVAIPLTFLKLVARFESSLFPPVFEASPRRLGAFYYHTLGPEAVALVVAVAVALVLGYRAKPEEERKEPMLDSGGVAFLVGLLAVPGVVMGALMKTHGAFFPRYGIATAFGYALLLAGALARWTGRSQLAAVGACCVLFIYDTNQIRTAYQARQLTQAWPAKEAALERVDPELPLVVASGLTYLEMSQYAAPAIADRLYYLTGRDLAIQYAHATMFQELAALRRYFPLRGTIEPYREFAQEHRRFLVFGTPEWPEDWLLRYLQDGHASVEPTGYFSGPYKDFQLFRVTLRDGVDGGRQQ